MTDSLSLPNIVAAVSSTPWAILPERLEAIIGVVARRAHGERLSADEIRQIASARRSDPQASGAIAVIPIYGIIHHRARMVNDISGPGGCSCESIGQRIDAAMNDPAIATIVLDIDSPGGTVTGVEELGTKIRGYRGKGKKIVAVANGMAASAAYWIGSQADEFVVTPSGEVGSIGVYMVHTDFSQALEKEGIKQTLIRAGKYKAEGYPAEPLSDEARAAFQDRVDESYDAFTRAVAKARGATPSAVRNGYGEGRVVGAKKAVELNLADRVATFEQVIQQLGGRVEQPQRVQRAEDDAPAVAAIDVQRDGVTLFIEGSVDADPDTIAEAVAQNLAQIEALSRTVLDGRRAQMEPLKQAVAEGITTAWQRLTESTSAGGAAAGDTSPPATAPAPEAKEHTVPENPGTTAAQNGAADLEAQRAAEAKRIKDITDLCVAHGVADQIAGHVASGVSADAVGRQILEQKRAKAIPGISVGAMRESEAPFASLGEQLQAIVRAGTPGGNTDPRLYGAASGASTATGSDGGFLIQREFATDLTGKGFETGVLASRCAKFELGANADSLEVVEIKETARTDGNRWGGVQVYRRGEADTVTAKKPALEPWSVRLEDMMGLAYATERLMQDAPAMGQVFSTAFADEFAFKIDNEIYRGTGVGECFGIFDSSMAARVDVAKESSQSADTIKAENVIKMWARLHPRSRANAAWFINPDCEPQLQQMHVAVKNVAGTENVGGYMVYMPPNGLTGAPYGTLFGRPVIPIEQASTVGDLGDIALLDLSQYALVTKGGLQQEESIHVRFVYNERAFRWNVRVNGRPKWRTAVTPFKGSNTLSPFVGLAERA